MSDSATISTAPKAHGKERSVARLIVATSIGNALEFYDLVVYGYFAGTLSKLFFPTHDHTVSLLLTLGTFALSYLARPVGALVLGSYSDRRGRKASLTLSIAMMTLGTAMVALMPTYATIGLAAPVLIFVSRLLQGFSAGGEFGSSTAFLVEHAPERSGFMSSWQFSSQGASTLLASLFGAVLTGSLTPAQLEGWGWRIPFLFGVLIGPIGLYIRRRIDETPEFEHAEKVASPVRELLATQKERLLVSIGSLVLTTTANYMLLYMPTYAARQLGLAPSSGFIATLTAGFIMMVLVPVVGHLGQVRAHAHHADYRRDLLPDRLSGLHVHERASVAADAARRRDLGRASQGDVLRADSCADVRAFPDRHAHDRHGVRLQHRHHCVRRLYAAGGGVAHRVDA